MLVSFQHLAAIVTDVTTSVSLDVTTVIMEDRCDHLIDLQDLGLPVMHVRLTDRYLYRPKMKCEMAVRAPPGQRLIVTFESLDIAPGYSGCADFLSLIDGDLQEQTPVPGEHR